MMGYYHKASIKVYSDSETVNDFRKNTLLTRVPRDGSNRWTEVTANDLGTQISRYVVSLMALPRLSIAGYIPPRRTFPECNITAIRRYQLRIIIQTLRTQGHTTIKLDVM
jgi:hypothetical protein